MADKDSFLEQPLLNVGNSAEAGSSGFPPPSRGGDAVVDVGNTSSGGNIISHDPRLNEDGA